jgi:hypothetical protein
MGAETMCTARFNGKTAAGTVRLESEVLQFRGGELKLSIPFAQASNITVRGGTLCVTFGGGAASFDLGPAAAKWAGKIRHPPSRLDKLGVKAASRVSAVGVADRAFLKELERAAAFLSIGRTATQSDLIFFGVSHERELARLERLKTALEPNGALWTIRPKGRPEISEASVMAAGKAAGLVDVKVVRFSETHTAEKFVIPVSARPRS